MAVGTFAAVDWRRNCSDRDFDPDNCHQKYMAMNTKYCFEHAELVKLCTSCTRHECPETGCDEYKNLKKQISQQGKKAERHALAEGKPEAMYAIELEIAPEKPVQCTTGTLRKCNAAIAALEELHADDGCDMMFDARKIRALVQYLREIRIQEYAAMIDWDAIAEKMEEKNVGEIHTPPETDR